MSLGRKIFLIFLILCAIGSFIWVRRLRARTTSLKGAVIIRDADPRKQLPITGVEVTATDGVLVANTKSDSSGLFSVALHKRIIQGQVIILQFRHPDYQPFDLNINASGRKASDQIYVAAIAPIIRKPPVEDNHPKQTISNVLVRYSIKTGTVVTIGSAVRSFETVNTGNVPCAGHRPCSPDGKWKAAVGQISLDAGPGNEFRNARASCIAGPCPFTTIDMSGLARDVRTIHVSALDWSDTATFLVEAEVVHPMTTDVVRNSYPVIFGDALNFTLPPAAEGVSIQAELNGETVIFPLGPALILSWADCNARTNPDQTRVYRCELKPGYKWPSGTSPS